MKASIDTKGTISRSHPTVEQAYKGNEDDADLAKLSEKDKKKEDARIAREKEKEKKKKERVEGRSKGKGKCADVKAGKKLEGSSKKLKNTIVMLSAKLESSGDDLPKILLVALSTRSLKRNAAFTGLSILRMQLDIIRKLKDCVGDSLNVDEFFFRGSFLSIEDHYAKHNNFPKEWLELKAFIEKV